MNKYAKMLKTEIKLSFRGMDMVIFALCLPVVMVVLLGIIYGNQRFRGSKLFLFRAVLWSNFHDCNLRRWRYGPPVGDF